MNWGGFPIGFRFPVQDFSWETKKRCWSYVLPALVYADLTDCTLQEAESAELFDPDRLVYIAVISPKKIPINRKNGLLWRQDGRLMSAITLYEPAVQENYLELYTKPKVLADITADRAVVPREGGECLFPSRIESKPKAPFHHRALILECRGFSVYLPSFVCSDVALLVDRLAENVEHTSEGLLADGHLNA